MIRCWLDGYLIVRLQGTNLEELLNKGLGQGMCFSHIHKVAPSFWVLTLKKGEYTKLQTILTGKRIRVRVLEKKGLPYLLASLRTRIGFLLGFLLMLGLIVYLSQFIWFIELTGNEGVDRTAIVKEAKEAGLYLGVRKGDLDLKKVEQHLRARIPALTWVVLQTKGVLMKVQVAEKTGLEMGFLDKGDIVADSDGVITHVVVFSGTQEVSQGTTVKKGDRLVAGEYYDAFGVLQQGRADALVLARVWQEGYGEVPFLQTHYEQSGRVRRHLGLTLNDKEWLLGRTFPFFHASREEYTLEGLPITFVVEKRAELLPTLVSYPPEVARERALMEALESLALPREFLLLGIEEKVDEDACRIRVHVEVERDIGRFVPSL